MTDDHARPVPGPLGWLEFTTRVLRDRSHTAWAWLGDEELAEALRGRGVLGALGPGEGIGHRDVVMLRLAVSPEGAVATSAPGQPPTPGPALEEFVQQLVEDLRTLALIDDEVAVGPPGLPADRLRQDAEQPDRDSRQVYAWPAEDAMLARVVAVAIGEQVEVHRVDGWVVAAAPPGSARILTQVPLRMGGAFPFVAARRAGQSRTLQYQTGRGEDALHLHVRWSPPLEPVLPASPHPKTVALGRWLADPSVLRRASDEERHGELSAEQDRVIQESLTGGRGPDLLRSVTAVLDVPTLVAELAELGPDDEPPAAPWLTVRSGSRMEIITATLRGDDEDDEPTGRGPFAALQRLERRRPVVGLTLGVGELLVALLLVLALLLGSWPWPWWLAVAVLVVDGGFRATVAGLRLRGPDPQ